MQFQQAQRQSNLNESIAHRASLGKGPRRSEDPPMQVEIRTEAQTVNDGP